MKKLESTDTVVFRHDSIKSVLIEPEITEVSVGNYMLNWTPFHKGYYSFYLNKKVIQQSKKIFVRAARVKAEFCQFTHPNAIHQLEKNKLIVQLKDSFSNSL